MRWAKEKCKQKKWKWKITKRNERKHTKARRNEKYLIITTTPLTHYNYLIIHNTHTDGQALSGNERYNEYVENTTDVGFLLLLNELKWKRIIYTKSFMHGNALGNGHMYRVFLENFVFVFCISRELEANWRF